MAGASSSEEKPSGQAKAPCRPAGGTYVSLDGVTVHGQGTVWGYRKAWDRNYMARNRHPTPRKHCGRHCGKSLGFEDKPDWLDWLFLALSNHVTSGKFLILFEPQFLQLENGGYHTD